MADDSQDWLTPKQFASLSGMSLPTVYRYLSAGVLPKFQPFGGKGKICIPRSALQCGESTRTVAGTFEAKAKPQNVVACPKFSGPKPAWMKTPTSTNSDHAQAKKK